MRDGNLLVMCCSETRNLSSFCAEVKLRSVSGDAWLVYWCVWGLQRCVRASPALPITLGQEIHSEALRGNPVRHMASISASCAMTSLSHNRLSSSTTLSSALLSGQVKATVIEVAPFPVITVLSILFYLKRMRGRQSNSSFQFIQRKIYGM